MGDSSDPLPIRNDGLIAGVSVPDLVARLRHELETVDAQRQEAGKPALLALDSVDVELQFTVTAAGEAGDAELRVLPVGTPDDVRAAEVQTLRLHFTVDESARREGVLGSRAHASQFTLQVEDDLEPLEDLEDDPDPR